MARIEYEVQIEGADNGITARFGCKKLVFKDEDMNGFLADLQLYLKGGRKGYVELYKKYFKVDLDEECKANAVTERCYPVDAPVPAPLYREEAQCGRG